MPHKEKNTHNGKRSEDPLPTNRIQFNLTDKTVDLNTLNFDKRNSVELTGPSVERLVGKLCCYSKIVLRDLPNLKSVEHLSSFGDVIIENCPNLEVCSQITADGNIVIENTALQEVPDTWTMGDMLVLKNNPSLKKVHVSDMGNEIYLHNLPQLRSLLGEMQTKSITISDCPSLEEADTSLRPELVSGLRAEDVHRLIANAPTLRSTHKIDSLDWDAIRAKNGSLNWEEGKKITKPIQKQKESIISKMLIFLGFAKETTPQKVASQEIVAYRVTGQHQRS